MSPIVYVGAAYACLWVLLLAYAWRLSATARRLSDKVEMLEQSLERR